jgi:hypothetical protein
MKRDLVISLSQQYVPAWVIDMTANLSDEDAAMSWAEDYKWSILRVAELPPPRKKPREIPYSSQRQQEGREDLYLMQLAQDKPQGNND